jgi:hypothetical protein
MRTEEEKRFVEYWRQNRDKEKKIFRQLLIGLPVGLLFAIPIILNFSAGWNKRATMWAQGHADDNTAMVLVIAALIIIVFVAIFSKRHKWDMCEQQYLEILSKPDGETATGEAGADTTVL